MSDKEHINHLQAMAYQIIKHQDAALGIVTAEAVQTMALAEIAGQLLLLNEHLAKINLAQAPTNVQNLIGEMFQHAKPIPDLAMVIEFMQDGKRYRGTAYCVGEQEQAE